MLVFGRIKISGFLAGNSMNSKVTGKGDAAVEVKKKIIDIFTYKQRLLSIDMKTKVVQHGTFFMFSKFSNFQVFRFSKHSWSPAFV